MKSLLPFLIIPLFLAGCTANAPNEEPVPEVPLGDPGLTPELSPPAQNPRDEAEIVPESPESSAPSSSKDDMNFVEIGDPCSPLLNVSLWEKQNPISFIAKQKDRPHLLLRQIHVYVEWASEGGFALTHLQVTSPFRRPQLNEVKRLCHRNPEGLETAVLQWNLKIPNAIRTETYEIWPGAQSRQKVTLGEIHSEKSSGHSDVLDLSITREKDLSLNAENLGVRQAKITTLFQVVESWKKLGYTVRPYRLPNHGLIAFALRRKTQNNEGLFSETTLIWYK